MIRGAFVAIQRTHRALFDFVKYAVNGFSRRGLNVRPGRAASNFLVEANFEIRQRGIVLFQNLSSAGEHLSAIHVAAIRKMPDGSRSHGTFLSINGTDWASAV